MHPLLFVCLLCLVAGSVRAGILKDSNEDYLANGRPGSRVVALTEQNFDSSLAQHDAWFVKFYAPWCGHCKKLALPWIELADEFEEIQFGKVDVTKEKQLAKRFGVNSFPQLKFFKDGVEMEYDGGRSIEYMSRYCTRQLGDPLTKVDSQTHTKARSQHPVAFFLLCPPEGCDKENEIAITDTARALLDHDFSFLQTSDPDLVQEYTSEEGLALPALVRYRKGDKTKRFPGQLKDADSVLAWAKENRFAMVSEIDAATYSHLSKTGKMMVLGLYDGGRPTNPGDKGSEQGRAQRKTLRAQLSALVPDNEDAFVFGSLDSREWHDFIQHRFGGGSTPRVVILDGDKVHFEEPARLHDLEGLLQDAREGNLMSASLDWVKGPPAAFWQKFQRNGMAKALEHHWMVLVVAGCLGILAVVTLYVGLCWEPATREDDKRD